MEYEVIRSRRKTLSLEVRKSGVTVRAPLTLSDEKIASFVEKHKRWIENRLKKTEEREKYAEEVKPLTAEKLKTLAEEAARVIPERVALYAGRIGVKYGRITVRNQRTRWGSCSSRGNLNFNCLLLLTPPEVLDSVVVHELCHLKQMNHSKAFYAEVLRAFPDYYRAHAWLKENGDLLLKRMPAKAEKG